MCDADRCPHRAARSPGHDLQDMYRAVWITLDYLCDLVYVLDIGVRFRTSK